MNQREQWTPPSLTRVSAVERSQSGTVSGAEINDSAPSGPN